jgi:hypothetical protein
MTRIRQSEYLHLKDIWKTVCLATLLKGCRDSMFLGKKLVREVVFGAHVKPDISKRGIKRIGVGSWLLR